MQYWNLKSACILSDNTAIDFKNTFKDTYKECTDLIEAMKFLSSDNINHNFILITTPTKHYLFINCATDQFEDNKRMVLDIIKNKKDLLSMKTGFRNKHF